MPYYKKLVLIELFVPIAVKAKDEMEAKEIIERQILDGKTIKFNGRNIRDRINFEEDIPVEISEEEYKKTSIKAH